MSDKKWTAEPWRVVEKAAIRSMPSVDRNGHVGDGQFIGHTNHFSDTAKGEANAARIVACVNLLARHLSLPGVVTLSADEAAKVRLALEMCGGCDGGYCGICGHKEGNHADSCEVLCAINAITPTKG